MYHVLKLHNTELIIGRNNTFMNEMTQTYDINGQRSNRQIYHATKIAECVAISHVVVLYRVGDVMNETNYYVPVNLNDESRNTTEFKHVYDVIDTPLQSDFDTDALREFADLIERVVLEN